MIVDFHTHLFPPELRADRARFFEGEPAFKEIYESSKARLAGVEDLLRHMDQAGIDKSVIFGFPWERSDNFKRNNDYVLETVGRYPDRFIGFACFSPLSPKGASEAERCISSGLRGVGELAVYGGGLNRSVIEALREVMAVCKDRDVPVLVHTNEPVGHQYPGKAPMTLKQVYDFVEEFAQNRIILAHWGGGLFFYGLMKKQVRETLQNVWFDTAASPFLYKRDVYVIAGDIIGYEKILFGTDFPLLPAERYFREMDAAGIEEEERRKITGGNAQTLLNIAQT
ncbi:MAG: amidohydrolase [Deltaproteobacteria bacterium]|nr:MAG: amidohydrolase [Deltaproteobacteria bacterium]